MLSATCALLVAAPFAVEAAPAAGQTTAHCRARPNVTVVKVTLGKPSEYAITVSTRSVTAGKVTFKVTNKGTVTNDFKICTKATTSTSYPNSCVGQVDRPARARRVRNDRRSP